MYLNLVVEFWDFFLVFDFFYEYMFESRRRILCVIVVIEFKL